MSRRADRVQARFEDIDALLVTDLINLRYLTGFTGSNGMCVVGPDLRRFITDFRYVERAAAEVDDFDREQGPTDFLSALAGGWSAGVTRLGFEDDKVTVRTYEKLREIVPDTIELVAAGLVQRERAIKDAGEIRAIATAAEVADRALSAALEAGLVGGTERAVAQALEASLQRDGATPAFGTIVAAGPNGAAPHATPGDRQIAAGTLVTIDFGAYLDGYNSDSTRTYAAGDIAGDLREIYELVLNAQETSLAAVTPGASGETVDAVARDLIAAAGHGDHFGHSLGHGVGLEVHEIPRLGRQSEDVLAPGTVVTVASMSPDWAAAPSKTSLSSPKAATGCSPDMPKGLTII